MFLYLKIFLQKIAFVGLSTTLAVLIIVLASNYYLKFSDRAKQSLFSDWTLDYTNFNLRYIFWENAWCDKVETTGCHHPANKLLPLPVESFGPDGSAMEPDSTSDCLTVIFLGDSFTLAPWVEPGFSYTSIFSKELAQKKNTCVESFRVATGGVGNSQQLAYFEDHVSELQPDIVIWQYYTNDVYNNVQLSVHELENNKLKRIFAWRNTMFWAGYLNQTFPLLRHTVLGKHLMYLGENVDIFRSWPADPKSLDSMSHYNSRVIPLFLDSMKMLSRNYNFQLITTLSPLECEFVYKYPCDYPGKYHRLIRKLLQDNSHFVSMEKIASPSAQVLGASTLAEQEYNQTFFNVENDSGFPGERHLSQKGNINFGLILFQNYLHENLDGF